MKLLETSGLMVASGCTGQGMLLTKLIRVTFHAAMLGSRGASYTENVTEIGL